MPGLSSFFELLVSFQEEKLECFFDPHAHVRVLVKNSAFTEDCSLQNFLVSYFLVRKDLVKSFQSLLKIGLNFNFFLRLIAKQMIE